MFFKRKPKPVAPGGFTDLHLHLLPAVDDGPADLEQALALHAGLRTLGYERFVATPHRYPRRFPLSTPERAAAALDELTAALAKIPSNFAVNVIPYSNGAKPHWNELREVDDENRKEILDFVRKLRVNGGTNIYGALEAAFADPSVDTIYLLTDGEPSVGDIVVPDEIADEVRRWNRLRQIVVHTIGIGIDSDLLKRLAEESGGVYKFVP